MYVVVFVALADLLEYKGVAARGSNLSAPRYVILLEFFGQAVTVEWIKYTRRDTRKCLVHPILKSGVCAFGKSTFSFVDVFSCAVLGHTVLSVWVNALGKFSDLYTRTVPG